ncbi:hypothetical protein M199_gp153 [Halogranum tailed virus 1]|uniref:Uncharacterized protein n=1 Tax=Halogranum tailed virus 1 TaxID=1273749 RepID=R4TMU7_9CAUD|nr:hypothetical protein M199_gp153 [Halogranum tailed virus 1]AGM11513.1 hypothetical protein HGTV1_216 [Halogranum tailed virus 1]
MAPDIFIAFLIIGMFFPIVSLIGAILLFLDGFGGAALILFVWWLLWEE